MVARMTLEAPLGGPRAGLDAVTPPEPARSRASELRLRIASGIVMVAASLALTWAGGWWFGGLVAAASAIMCWEWGRLARGADSGLDRCLALHAVVVVAVVVLTLSGHPGWGFAILLPGMLALHLFDNQRPLTPFGLAYVGVPALVMVWLRREPDYGLAAILYLFLAVWVTDIAAYAAGRTFGGPKLAPSISPGKTWSGLAGGVAMSGLAGAAFGAFVPGGSAVRLGFLAVVLALAAQIGDLAESALKRRSGLKDASGLIPGHGGLLDRVDGLVAAVAVVAALVVLRHADAPARGLMLGL